MKRAPSRGVGVEEGSVLCPGKGAKPGMPMQDHKPGERIRVLLADDHTMFREGLANILASYGGMHVVAEVPNDQEAAKLVRTLQPDVVIMQVQMPFEKARESLRRMRSLSPAPKVVVVTMFEEPRYIRELMELGASAYLVKSASTEHLVAAIRAAVFDPESKNVIVEMPRGMVESTRVGSVSVLSVRELEILLLAARGLSNRQISNQVNVAEATVKRHLANVYEKMGVRSRGEAARKALAEEWITIKDITEDGKE
jgi:DNA-binding NarL/FixJ family response regulator